MTSGSFNETIHLWNPQTGRQIGESLTGHCMVRMSLV